MQDIWMWFLVLLNRVMRLDANVRWECPSVCPSTRSPIIPSARLSLLRPSNTSTHHHNVAWSVLDGAKQAQDDDDNVKEVGQDRRPLVAQEVKYLSFQCHHLGQQKTALLASTICMPYTITLFLRIIFLLRVRTWLWNRQKAVTE